MVVLLLWRFALPFLWFYVVSVLKSSINGVSGCSSGVSVVLNAHLKSWYAKCVLMSVPPRMIKNTAYPGMCMFWSFSVNCQGVNVLMTVRNVLVSHIFLEVVLVTVVVVFFLFFYGFGSCGAAFLVFLLCQFVVCGFSPNCCCSFVILVSCCNNLCSIFSILVPISGSVNFSSTSSFVAYLGVSCRCSFIVLFSLDAFLM